MTGPLPGLGVATGDERCSWCKHPFERGETYHQVPETPRIVVVACADCAWQVQSSTGWEEPR